MLWDLVRSEVKSYGRFVLYGWLFTALVLQTAYLWENRVDRAKLKALEALPFEHFMIYYGVYPSNPTPTHGAVIYHVSDSEVKQGGFRVEWREYIECDDNPHDNLQLFEYYEAVQITDKTYKSPRARSPVLSKSGYPARSRVTGEVLKYPYHDSDCRMISTATQYHKYGHIKQRILVGAVARVRG